MATGVRRLGDGYEPHVDECDGSLRYSLPVESGFASASFSYPITDADLAVLQSDPYRRAALEIIAHTLLQPAVGGPARPLTQRAFAALVRQVLHSTPAALHACIAQASHDHHIAIAVFIEQALARRAR